MQQTELFAEHSTHTNYINLNDYIISISSSLLCLALPWLGFNAFLFRNSRPKIQKIIKLILFWTHGIYFEQQQQEVSLLQCVCVSTKMRKKIVLIWIIWIKTIVFLQSSMRWQQLYFFADFILFFFLRHVVTSFATHHKANLYIQLIWLNLKKYHLSPPLLCFCFDLFDWLTFSCTILIDFTQFNRFPVSSFYLCTQNQEVEISLRML